MNTMRAPAGTSIRKMGTRGGQPHYGVECLACPHVYGHRSVVRVAHLSREGAQAVALAHLASHDRSDTECCGRCGAAGAPLRSCPASPAYPTVACTNYRPA